MINVMLDPLPVEWNGYKVNTDFRIGIQIYILQYDKDLNKFEKIAIIEELLFGDREHPEDIQNCLEWYLNGWYHDNTSGEYDRRRLVDYDIDQWRIYADFLKIYGIDLAVVDMHWWKFNGLLWNMPYKQSSFMEVIDIRKKTVKGKMSADEREAIKKAKKIYDLEQVETKKYSDDEMRKIDAYDKMMAKKKQTEKEALELFRR